MTMPSPNIPDVSANYMIAGSASTTVLVWLVDSFTSMSVPAGVASALTTLIAVGLGVWKGDSSKSRRSTDPK